jgi:phage/plasmid-like protein (TIGR03299 family)
MAHEVETMTFAHEVPWHGLGNRVDPKVSVDEMLVQAGLDWQVNKLPLYAQRPNGKPLKIPGRHALVRSSDDKIMSVTGEQWQPFQNAEMLGFFRRYADAGKVTLETAGSLKGGKLIWGLANLNDGFQSTKGDHTKGYLLIISPHEVGMAIKVYTTTIRVVCANTMRLATDGARHTYSQNHMKSFSVEDAEAAVELAHAQLKGAGQQAKVLVKHKMSDLDTVEFLARFLQPLDKEQTDMSAKLDKRYVQTLMEPGAQNKHLTEVLASVNKGPGAVPGTAWGVLQGYLHWSNHVVGRSIDNRMTQTWVGDRSRITHKVNDELMALAS